MIDCSASFVDGSEALSQGRVLVCLRDATTGQGYFQGYDIEGGIAVNASVANTGFVGGSSNYTQHFDVGGNEPANFQCFYVDYSPVPGATTDTLVIQAYDGSNNTSGDACEMQFNVPQVSTPELDCDNSLWTNP